MPRVRPQSPPSETTPVQGSVLQSLVQEYLTTIAPSREIDLKWYGEMSSLSEVITRAALGQVRGGVRHPHQRHTPRHTLEAAAKRVAKVKRLDRARDFEELLAQVTKACWGLRGLGVLTRYDIAFRIGLYLKKYPRYVYLHAGPREGAKALGLPHTRAYLSVGDLPLELRSLEPWQVEDFLCVYKDELRPAMRVASP
jgi:hypothetical protein